jgi:hypothetical protein
MSIKEVFKIAETEIIDIYTDVYDIRLEGMTLMPTSDKQSIIVSFVLQNHSPANSPFNIPGFEKKYDRVFKKIVIDKKSKKVESMQIHNA